MNKRFQGQVAIITGAGQGIGLAIAQALVREGGKLILKIFNELVTNKELIN